MDKEIRRLPTGEAKTSKPTAEMGPNKHLEAWGNNQVPENSRLVKFYQNPFGGKLGEKRTIDDSMDNGGKFESEAGGEASITNHIVGHLGTHKI